MRLAVITNAYPPDARGGAGNVAADLVALWKAAGHDVRVWSAYAAWLSRGPLTRLFGHLFLDLRAASFLPEVVSWKPDIVITHNLTGTGLGTGAACLRAGIPWIHVLHDVQLFEPSGQLRADIVTSWQRFWSAWRRRSFGVPSLAVSPTRWLLEAHARRGWRFARTEVLPNPGPEPIVAAADANGPWAFLGRLSEDKGGHLLAALARSRPEERFVCVGDGPLRGGLERLPNVRCVGARSRDGARAVLANARGLLMPSRLQENQPTVLLEAFAAGVPAIASDRGGIPETLGEAGIVAELDLGAWMRACDRVRAEWGDWHARSARRAAAFSRELAFAHWELAFRSVR